MLGLYAGEQVTAEHRQNVLWATVKAVESVENHPDPDALTTKALHLGDGADPRDAARRTDLLQMAATAAALGRDTYNPTVLAAYDLERHGALDSSSLITGKDGSKAGRSWAGRSHPPPLWTDRYVTSPDGDLANGTPASAPWSRQRAGKGTGPGGYVLDLRETTPGRVDLSWPGSTTRSVPYDEIAELLAHDPVLARLDLDVAVVPVGVGGSVGLAEAVAARTATARSVWLPARPLHILERPGANESLFLLTAPADSTAHWSPVRPPRLPGHAAEASAATAVTTTGSAPEAGTGGSLAALAAALDRAAPGVLPPAAAEPGGDALFRDWLDGRLAAHPPEAEGPGGGDTASLLEPDTMIPVGELARVGVELDLGRQTQAILQDGRLRAGELKLTTSQQLRLLLARADGESDARSAKALAAWLATELSISLT